MKHRGINKDENEKRINIVYVEMEALNKQRKESPLTSFCNFFTFWTNKKERIPTHARHNNSKERRNVIKIVVNYKGTEKNGFMTSFCDF